VEGRPLMLEPELKKAWAGSWLICSVCMERTMQSSSARDWMWGKRSEISAPDWPHFLKAQKGPRAFSTVFWSCASCCPAVKEAGKGLPSSSWSLGLKSKVSKWEGPPAMHRWMMRLALMGKWGGLMMPRQRLGLSEELAEDPAAEAASPLWVSRGG